MVDCFVLVFTNSVIFHKLIHTKIHYYIILNFDQVLPRGLAEGQLAIITFEFYIKNILEIHPSV